MRFLLFLVLCGVMLSCDKDDFQEVEEKPQVELETWLLNNTSFNEVVNYVGKGDLAEDQVFQGLLNQLEGELIYGFTEIDFDWDFSTLDFIEISTRSRPKAGPCLDAYKIEFEAANANLGICLGDVAIGLDPRPAIGCVLTHAVELNKAEKQFDLCLETTYPNADGG